MFLDTLKMSCQDKAIARQNYDVLKMSCGGWDVFKYKLNK